MSVTPRSHFLYEYLLEIEYRGLRLSIRGPDGLDERKNGGRGFKSYDTVPPRGCVQLTSTVKGVHSIIIGKTVVPGDKLDMDIGQ